jgi:hypothetical protein
MPGQISFDKSITTTPLVLEDGIAIGSCDEDGCIALFNYTLERTDLREIRSAILKAVRHDLVARAWLRRSSRSREGKA